MLVANISLEEHKIHKKEQAGSFRAFSCFSWPYARSPKLARQNGIGVIEFFHPPPEPMFLNQPRNSSCCDA